MKSGKAMGIYIHYNIFLKNYNGSLGELIDNSNKQTKFPYSIALFIKTKKIFKYITKINNNPDVILSFISSNIPFNKIDFDKVNFNFIDYDELLDIIIQKYGDLKITGKDKCSVKYSKFDDIWN